MISAGIRLYFVTAVLSIALTALLVKVARARGWVVFPRQNRWNKRVVAQFGGAAVLLAFFPAAILVATGQREYLLLLFATAAMGLLGFIDDIKGLGPKPKLIIEFFFAALVVYGGIVYPITTSSLANQILTAFAIVAITNAFNLIDNMDGLAGGVAFITLVAISLLVGTNTSMGMLALLLMGAVTGFLVFNLNPARIFMGDLGSLPIGFFLACSTAVAAQHFSQSSSGALVSSLLLIVPIFDIFLVTVTRRASGRAVSDGARDHTSHRLVFLGLGERAAVGVLHILALTGGAMALLWAKFPGKWTAAGIALFLTALLHVWFYFARTDLPRQWLSQVFVSPPPELLRKYSSRSMRVFLSATLCWLGAYLASIIPWAGPIGRQQLAILAAVSAVAKVGMLVIVRGHGSAAARPFSTAGWRVAKAVGLSAVIILPCWIVAGVPADKAALLLGLDMLITGMLLFLGRTSSTLLDWLFDKQLVIVMDEQPAARIAPQLGGAIAHPEVDFSNFAGSNELADELEL